MYKIAICDDEPFFLESLMQTVQKILDKTNIPFQLTSYSSGQALFEYLQENNDAYDILLLDILLTEELTGIELAKKIRNQGDFETAIIFITSSREYALEGYDARPLHYLLKPVDEKVLGKLLIENYNSSLARYIQVRQGNRWIQINIDKVEYIEKIARKAVVHEAHSDITLSHTLAELELILPKESFMRCHQGFIINIQNITELNRLSAITKSGTSVPVSRSRSKDIQNAFLDALHKKSGSPSSAFPVD